jgi:aminoglycoside phosphotransferase (APT) family kinase protein
VHRDAITATVAARRVGDPACDLVVAWTLLDGASRARFVEGIGQDTGTWARARGWALWKALITLATRVARRRPMPCATKAPR